MNPNFASYILAVLAFTSAGITFWRWVVSLRFPLHQRTAPKAPAPACTLLKPLKGCDAETKACLRTWLTQVYAAPVQVLFGVASEDDPACVVVRELLNEFPQADAQLVFCGKTLGVNAKVSTLRQLQPLISNPLVVISDADTSAPDDLLANLAAHFEKPEIGLVNCFYSLANPATEAMRWEAVAINADFWSSVLQAESFMEVDFALGAVMALPMAQLEAIGGFAALADYLADDFQLGREIVRQGKRVEFSNVVVECRDAPMGWRRVWWHQVRWARTIRACQPWPFFFSVLDNSTFWPLLWLAVNHSVGCVVLAFLAFRIATALHLEKRLTRRTAHYTSWWMPPVKDLLNIGVWAAAFSGNHVHWHGEQYRILTGGKLEKAG